MGTFLSGDTVSACGIYAVFHSSHRLSATAVLFKGERFPKCSKCGEPVTFDLSRSIEALDIGQIHVRVPVTDLQAIDE